MIDNFKTNKNGISRRGFLKTTAAGGAALAGLAAGCAPEAQEATEEAAETNPEGYSLPQVEKVEEQIFNQCCRPNCFNTCMMNVHVRDGKVVKTSPADFPNTEFNRICLRGLCHVENIYHPDRVLYPMKRVGGERGNGEWERVSWDDALNDIAEKFTQYRKEFGDSSIFHIGGSSSYHATTATIGKFFGAINASSISPSLDMGNNRGITRAFGFAGLWPGNDPRDYLNTKTLFLWGNNLTDAQIQDWHFVADAIENGTYVVCVDPIFTQMAAKSNKWVPVRPGCDLPLIMGMMNVVLSEDLVDWDFMTNHTVAPFLVKESDGLFLRMSDLGVEPTVVVDEATGTENTIDPYAVWDSAANAAAELSTVAEPALEGTFDVNGVKVTTAFTLLKTEIEKYDPETASEMCGIAADEISELAHLAVDGPVYHRVGWGPQAYDNGIAPHHAGATLAALTGQIGEPGAGYAAAQWMMFLGANPAVNAIPEGIATDATPSPAISYPAAADAFTQGKAPDGTPFTPKAAWFYCGNPVCTWCDTNSLKHDILDKFELIVTVDNMMTDTARYSDYVLPCSHWFEYEDAVVYGNSFHLIHTEKAVEPAGESRCDMDIMRDLASRMGLPENFYQESNEAYLRDYFSGDACDAMGISYDALCEQKAIRAYPDPYQMWMDKTFLTPSTRVEFYIENPFPYNAGFNAPDLSREHMPVWFEPREALDTNALAEDFPFHLMSERPRYRVHGGWSYTQILRELDPEPTVKMNPSDAAANGLEDGQHVECYNDNGHAVAKLVLNEAIRPGCLVYPKSWQSDQHLAGGWSEPLSHVSDPVLMNQSFMDCRVAVRAWEE